MANERERLFEVMGRLDKTFKPKLNEELEDIMDTEVEDEVTVEPQEHGEEGPSYKAKLECIVNKAQKVYEGLPEGEIPHWVQDKITLAEDYLKSIYGWMHGEEEEKEGDEEGANREMDADEKDDEEDTTDSVADVEFEEKDEEIEETDDPEKKDRDMERQDVSQEWERADEYEKLFVKTIKAHGYKPNELDAMPKEEKRKFFDELDKKWKSDKED